MEGEETTTKSRGFSEYINVKPKTLGLILLGIILWFGVYIRTLPLPNLRNRITGELIPIGIDPYVFVRYAKEILETGSLMATDILRYHPIGFTGLDEFKILSYSLVYLHKILSVFSSNITIETTAAIYPVIAFVVSLILFYILIQKIFDWKVALASSAFLSVLPAYFMRTIAGFTDKEPFAMVLLFLSLLFFVYAINSKKKSFSFITAGLSGTTAGLMWMVWGGASFLFLTVGIFMLTMIFLGKVNKRHLLSYTLFLFVLILVYAIGFPDRAKVLHWVVSTSYDLLAMFLALLVGWINYFFFTKNKFGVRSKIKIPGPFASLLFAGIIAVVASGFRHGPGYLFRQVGTLFTLLTSPASFDRWTSTVAESQQTFFTDFMNVFGWLFILLMFIGAIYLFYETFKSLGKDGNRLTVAFAAFIFFFSISKYSNTAQLFNGTNPVSTFVYLGSLIGFLTYFAIVLYIHHNKSENRIHNFTEVNSGYLLMLIFFFFTFLGALSAIRLFFSFAPAAAIFGGFAVVMIIRKSLGIKQKYIKSVVWVVFGITLLFIFQSFITYGLLNGAAISPTYDERWQEAMVWAEENTLESAAFAGWWDYGYYIQYGANRATLSDGGNARGAINYLTGRHLLTGQNASDVTQFMAANKATHIIMTSEDINKYYAFSAIGSDGNYDRRTSVFFLPQNPARTSEGRNTTKIVYGLPDFGIFLDEDILFDNVILPEERAILGEISVPVVLENGDDIVEVKQPIATIAQNGVPYNVPVNCIYYNEEEILFEGDGIDGCVYFVPTTNGGVTSRLGAVLYLSPKVYKSSFVKLYLLENEWEGFELVYEGEEELVIENGISKGPLKIWEVKYPKSLDIAPQYKIKETPQESQIV